MTNNNNTRQVMPSNNTHRPVASDIIKLKAVGENREIHFRVKTTSKLGKLKKSYCKRVVRFLLKQTCLTNTYLDL